MTSGTHPTNGETTNKNAVWALDDCLSQHPLQLALISAARGSNTRATHNATKQRSKTQQPSRTSRGSHPHLLLTPSLLIRFALPIQKYRSFRSSLSTGGSSSPQYGAGVVSGRLTPSTLGLEVPHSRSPASARGGLVGVGGSGSWTIQ